MRPRTTLLVLVAGLISAGCLSGFRHPLGAPEDGFIENELPGRWSCISADEPKTTELTFIDFDGKQYFMEASAERESERGRYRAHATRVGGAPFLSIREIGGHADEEWHLLEYDVRQTDRLRLRYVDPHAFKDVIDDAAAVRDQLVEKLHDPEVVGDLLSCTRVEDERR